MTEDTLETVDGELVHAVIGDVTLDVVPASGNVILSVELLDPYRIAGTVLDAVQIHRLIHALSCALTPYGGKP